MALFDGAEHEPLSAAVWNEERVRAGIDRIVVGTRDALDPGRVLAA